MKKNKLPHRKPIVNTIQPIVLEADKDINSNKPCVDYCEECPGIAGKCGCKITKQFNSRKFKL